MTEYTLTFIDGKPFGKEVNPYKNLCDIPKVNLDGSQYCCESKSEALDEYCNDVHREYHVENNLRTVEIDEKCYTYDYDFGILKFGVYIINKDQQFQAKELNGKLIDLKS